MSETSEGMVGGFGRTGWGFVVVLLPSGEIVVWTGFLTFLAWAWWVWRRDVARGKSSRNHERQAAVTIWRHRLQRCSF